MKVVELIKLLSSMPADAEVIVQKDAEGNGYSPLEGADENCVYIAETTWYGEVYDITVTAEEMDMDETEWSKIVNRPRCVVLFPTN